MSRIHVQISGSGPDLVLLHGWAMHSGIWCHIREQLAQHFRLHLVDLPGHGMSSDCEVETLAQMATAVAEILPDDCILCGWSLGGQVAIELASQQPNKINNLVLISTTPCFVQCSDWQWGMNTATFQLFMNNLEQDYTATINRFLSLQLCGSNNSHVMLSEVRKNFFQYSPPKALPLKAGLEILRKIDLREQFYRITPPVLILHGDNDVITDAAAATWMHQQLPGSTLVMFQKCGHAPFLSHPDQFVTYLNELRSHPG